jgi:hypothetical protein
MDRAKIENTPVITWYLAAASATPVTLEVRSLDGNQSRVLNVPAKAGITRFAWDGRFDPPAGYEPPPPPPGESAFLAAFRQPPGALAGPGVYSLVLTTPSGSVQGVLRIREDPLVSGAR